MQIDSQSAGMLILIRFGQILKEIMLFGKNKSKRLRNRRRQKNSKLIPVNSGEFRWDSFLIPNHPSALGKPVISKCATHFLTQAPPLPGKENHTEKMKSMNWRGLENHQKHDLFN